MLVTGAAGFIGGHLVEDLILRGAQVRAFVRYGSVEPSLRLQFLPEAIRNAIDIRAGDITDLETVRSAARGASMVFHLAALIAIPYSYIAPRSYIHTNVEGTLNVMLAARDEGVQRIVHVSTSETYGTAQYVPMDESHPLSPQSPYAATKAGGDLLVRSFCDTFGLPAVIARPFNAFGPRQSRRALIPSIISQALSSDEIMLGATNTTRDFNYVSDTVNGLVALAEQNDVSGEVVNLGSGVETSVMHVVELIGRLLDRPLTVTQSAERMRPEHSEVQRLVCDSSKARRLMQWTPKTTLEDGLRRSIEWYREQTAAAAPARYEI